MPVRGSWSDQSRSPSPIHPIEMMALSGNACDGAVADINTLARTGEAAAKIHVTPLPPFRYPQPPIHQALWT